DDSISDNGSDQRPQRGVEPGNAAQAATNAPSRPAGDRPPRDQDDDRCDEIDRVVDQQELHLWRQRETRKPMGHAKSVREAPAMMILRSTACKDSFSPSG